MPVDCILDPEGKRILTQQEVRQLWESLKDPMAEVELMKGLLQEDAPGGLLRNARDAAKEFSDKAPFSRFLSPSFYLELSNTGRNMIRRVDETMRQKARRVKDSHDIIQPAVDKSGVRKGTPNDALTARIQEVPELGHKVDPKIRDLSGKLRKETDKLLTELGMKEPEAEMGAVQNYLHQFFQPEDLVVGLEAERASLMAGAPSRTVAMRLAQVNDAIARINAGDTITYHDMPSAMRGILFESRNPSGGSSISALKVYDYLLQQASNKLYMEPLVKELTPLIDKLPPSHRPLARAYLRDAIGIGDKISDPVTRVLAGVREFQFWRTMGWSGSVSTFNFFQKGFTAAEIGLGHTAKGWRMAYTPAGRSIFEASGHGLEIPTMFIQNPQGIIPKWKKVLSSAGWLFQKVEYGNRITSYLAGLDAWFAKNGSRVGMTLDDAMKLGYDGIPAEAKQFADDLVRKTQFKYGKTDLPLALRGPYAATAFQFASFHIKALELLWKWSVREGTAGRKKLAAYLAAGTGVTTLSGLAGFPTIGENLGMPINVVEMINAVQGLSQGDIAQAKAALLNVVELQDLVPGPGPTAKTLMQAADLARKGAEGTFTTDALAKFGKDNLLQVNIKRVWEASQQLEAGGSARDFVQITAGLPTGDAIIRKQILSLAEQGKSNTVKDLLTAWKEVRGGTLPLNQQVIARLKRESKTKMKVRETALKQETPFEKRRRQQTGRVDRLLRSPILNIDAQGIIP